jgi:hypothetical protein
MARIPRLHLRDVGPAITLRENFNAPNLTGRTTGGGLMLATSPPGDLSGPDLAAWRLERWNVRYVVRSYETPIAWYVVLLPSLGEGRWYIVAEKFGGKMGRHQAALPESIKAGAR